MGFKCPRTIPQGVSRGGEGWAIPRLTLLPAASPEGMTVKGVVGGCCQPAKVRADGACGPNGANAGA
eukprot:11949368-Heterocapsa_arctica.AAC.1